MKRKVIIGLLLILSLFFLFVNNAENNAEAAVNHKSLVSEYYFKGVYTKKSNIYLTTESEQEIKKYFHGDVALDRTTYYKDDILLMGDIDGGFDEINSGYRNNGNDMSHFTYQDGMIVDDYYVANTNIFDYYVSLKKISDANYFDSTWVNGVHDVVSEDDKYLSDFLAFTAPCLTELVFNAHYIQRVGMKLTISEETHLSYGDHLVLRIYSSSLDEGKVGSDLILSEARIYKGNSSFNEDVVMDTLAPLKEAVDKIGSNYKSETTVYFNELALERIKVIYGIDYQTNQTTYFNENYIYRYSNNFIVNEAYYKLGGNLHKTTLVGETLENKLNSNVNHEESTLSDYKYFSLEALNSSYINNYGATTIKYNSSYSKEFLGWFMMGENLYYCDRTEVIEDFLDICAPGFSNEGTYMTFRYVTITINTDGSLTLRLYASPTQIGKVIQTHKDIKNFCDYLLFAEAHITDVDDVNINALENVLQ